MEEFSIICINHVCGLLNISQGIYICFNMNGTIAFSGGVLTNNSLIKANVRPDFFSFFSTEFGVKKRQARL